MDVPEEYGGLGLDAVTTCLIREAIGYVDAGFASSFAASTFGIKPVLLAGTEEQKKAYGARLAEGQISAMCLTEPQSGSDMGNTKCRAVKDGDEYVLNGTKCFITNGGIADIYTVAASTSPELGSAGISLFIVDRNTPGVSVGKERRQVRYPYFQHNRCYFPGCKNSCNKPDRRRKQGDLPSARNFLQEPVLPVWHLL